MIGISGKGKLHRHKNNGAPNVSAGYTNYELRTTNYIRLAEFNCLTGIVVLGIVWLFEVFVTGN